MSSVSAHEPAMATLETNRQLVHIQREIDAHLEAKYRALIRLGRETLSLRERDVLLKAVTSDDPILRSLLNRKWVLQWGATA